MQVVEFFSRMREVLASHMASSARRWDSLGRATGQVCHREGATDVVCAALVFNVAEGVVPYDRWLRHPPDAGQDRRPQWVWVMVAPRGMAGEDVGVLPMTDADERWTKRLASCQRCTRGDNAGTV